MTARTMIFVISILFGASIAPTSAAEDLSKTSKRCDNADPKCGLMGISQTELLDSLFQGITNLPHGLSGSAIGFPAEVLAAAYAIDAKGNIFSFKGTLEAAAAFPVEGFTPHYYSYRTHQVMLSRLEVALSQAKLHLREPINPPAIVALNLPGVGPRVYDADQLRKLSTTDLFPYPMHIEWMRSSGVLVPYVQLDSSAANFVRNCLSKLGLERNKPPSKLITGTECPLEANTGTNINTVQLAPREPAAFLAKGMLDVSGNNGSPKKVETQKDVVHQQELAPILFYRATSTKPILVATSAPCKLPTQLNFNEPALQSPDQLRCAFESKLTIPGDIGPQYEWIRVTVMPIRPRSDGLICGPKEPLLHVEIHDKVDPVCSAEKAIWKLSGDVLMSDSDPAQVLTTLVTHNRDPGDPEYKSELSVINSIRSLFAVRIILEGHYGTVVDDAIRWFRGILDPQLRNQFEQQNPESYEWCIPKDACGQ